MGNKHKTIKSLALQSAEIKLRHVQNQTTALQRLPETKISKKDKSLLTKEYGKKEAYYHAVVAKLQRAQRMQRKPLNNIEVILG